VQDLTSLQTQNPHRWTARGIRTQRTIRIRRCGGRPFVVSAETEFDPGNRKRSLNCLEYRNRLGSIDLPGLVPPNIFSHVLAPLDPRGCKCAIHYFKPHEFPEIGSQGDRMVGEWRVALAAMKTIQRKRGVFTTTSEGVRDLTSRELICMICGNN
jgi:hypothetical protein